MTTSSCSKSSGEANLPRAIQTVDELTSDPALDARVLAECVHVLATHADQLADEPFRNARQENPGTGGSVRAHAGPGPGARFNARHRSIQPRTGPASPGAASRSTPFAGPGKHE